MEIKMADLIESLAHGYGRPKIVSWRQQIRTADLQGLGRTLAASRRVLLLIAEHPDGRFAVQPQGPWSTLSPWPTLPLQPGPVDVMTALSTLAAAIGWECDPRHYLLAAKLSLRDGEQARLGIEAHAVYGRARRPVLGPSAMQWVGWHELIGPLRRALWQTPEPLARVAQRLSDAILSQVRACRREGK